MLSRRPGARFNRGRIAAGLLERPLNFTQQVQAALLPRLQGSLLFTQEIECTMVPRVSGGTFDPLQWRNVLTTAGHTVGIYLQADTGITLATGMAGSGAASPPSVTLTGTLAQAKTIRVEMVVGGARGTATFDCFVDDVLVLDDTLTAATVAITGHDLTLNFATGTYDAAHQYDSRLNVWSDQSGNARHGTQGTAASQPLYNELLNGRRIITADGSADFVPLAWDPSAPGTLSYWIYFVARCNAFVSGDRLFGGNSANLRVSGTGTQQALAANGTASSALTMTDGTWFRGIAYFSASADAGTGDYFRLGDETTGRGASFGNNDATGFALFATSAGATPGAYSMSLFTVVEGAEPSAGTIAALDALTVSPDVGYGSGVVI